MGGKYSKMDPMEVPIPGIQSLIESDDGLRHFQYEVRKRLVKHM